MAVMSAASGAACRRRWFDEALYPFKSRFINVAGNEVHYSEERQGFEQRFPNSHTHLLHGAGHYIQEDAAGAIVQAIDAWWPGGERYNP
jgi:pimeloyl-ACP methyl ester carboxylesterase